MVLLALLFKFTRAGKWMQATADNPKAATLVGIPRRAAASSAVRRRRRRRRRRGRADGAADACSIPTSASSCSSRASPQPSSAGCTARSARSSAALILGLVEALAAGYLQSSLQEVAAFVVIMFALIFIPRGILGGRACGRSDMRWLLGSKAFLVALAAAFALLPAFGNPYTLFVANLVMLYMILAVGLNLLVGYAGQLAFANAAMFGIGAYGAGLLQVKLGLPYWLALPGGAASAMLIGTTMAFPALRLSGIYLALATLAFAQATQWVAAALGVRDLRRTGFSVPRVDFASLPISNRMGIYYLSWASPSP